MLFVPARQPRYTHTNARLHLSRTRIYYTQTQQQQQIFKHTNVHTGSCNPNRTTLAETLQARQRLKPVFRCSWSFARVGRKTVVSNGTRPILFRTVHGECVRSQLCSFGANLACLRPPLVCVCVFPGSQTTREKCLNKSTSVLPLS